MNKLSSMLVVTSLALSGCMTTGGYIPPVEDRSDDVAGGNTRIETVDRSSQVAVTQVYDAPVIRSQRSDADVAEIQVQPVSEAPSVAVAEVPASSQNAATVALLDTAVQQQRDGDLRKAQASLERAQRIDPRDPQVYYRLADVRRQMGQFVQAEQVALKGVAMASGQSGALKRLWNLIADIRGEAGDEAGARVAKQNADRY